MQKAIPKTKSNKKTSSFGGALGEFDLPFLVLVILLLLIGLIMMYSASYPEALYRLQDSSYYIVRQVIFAVIGVAAMFGISFVNYKFWHKLGLPLLIVSVILLVAVFFFPPINYAHRWIILPGLTFQPSEIAKFAIVITFGHLIAINYNKMKTFRYGVLPFILILGCVAALVIRQPHLSGTILIILLGLIMMFAGGTSLKWFGFGGAAIAGAIIIAVVFFDIVPVAMNRFETWMDPFVDPQGAGHQTIQSLYAIGSGGFWGVGLGNSRQKHLYIPEPQNDFVFAVVCEELGFVGATLIIILFGLLVWRGFVIAMRAPDKFGSMVALGLVMQVGLQVLLNIAVVTNTIPNTGIGLPFFSAGGTALCMLLFQMGVVLSISRYSNVRR